MVINVFLLFFFPKSSYLLLSLFVLLGSTFVLGVGMVLVVLILIFLTWKLSMVAKETPLYTRHLFVTN